MRTQTAEVQALVRDRMQAICDGVAATFGARIEFEYRVGYPATISSEAYLQLLPSCAVSRGWNAHELLERRARLNREETHQLPHVRVRMRLPTVLALRGL